MAIWWIHENWCAVFLMGVGVLVIMFLVVLGCHFLLPRPEHMVRCAQEKRRWEQRQEERMSRMSGVPGQGDEIHLHHYRP